MEHMQPLPPVRVRVTRDNRVIEGVTTHKLFLPKLDENGRVISIKEELGIGFRTDSGHNLYFVNGQAETIVATAGA